MGRLQKPIKSRENVKLQHMRTCLAFLGPHSSPRAALIASIFFCRHSLSSGHDLYIIVADSVLACASRATSAMQTRRERENGNNLPDLQGYWCVEPALYHEVQEPANNGLQWSIMTLLECFL